MWKLRKQKILLFFLLISFSLTHTGADDPYSFGDNAFDNSKDNYIILLKDNSPQTLGELEKIISENENENTLRKADSRFLADSFGAISTSLSSNQVINVKALDGVLSVEEDRIIDHGTNDGLILDADVVDKLNESEASIPGDGKFVAASVPEASMMPSWALDRINQRSLPLDGKIESDFSPAQEVDVFVVDTGVDITHPDFEGRAHHFHSYNYSDHTDGHGHGTHVAGLITSRHWGASRASVQSVKVIPSAGRGPLSWVLQGLNAVRVQRDKTRPAVVSMSLHERTESPALKTAIQALVDEGVVVVNAAGNGMPYGSNTCNSIPASMGITITVSATNDNDELAKFSNYGSCIDIMAPGESIQSVWPNGQLKVLSGTSQACPLVAGAVANFLSIKPDATIFEVKEMLLSMSTKDKISFTGAQSAPNRLLYVAPSDLTADNSFKLSTVTDMQPTSNYFTTAKELVTDSVIFPGPSTTTPTVVQWAPIEASGWAQTSEEPDDFAEWPSETNSGLLLYTETSPDPIDAILAGLTTSESSTVLDSDTGGVPSWPMSSPSLSAPPDVGESPFVAKDEFGSSTRLSLPIPDASYEYTYDLQRHYSSSYTTFVTVLEYSSLSHESLTEILVPTKFTETSVINSELFWATATETDGPTNPALFEAESGVNQWLAGNILSPFQKKENTPAVSLRDMDQPPSTESSGQCLDKNFAVQADYGKWLNCQLSDFVNVTGTQADWALSPVDLSTELSISTMPDGSVQMVQANAAGGDKSLPLAVDDFGQGETSLGLQPPYQPPGQARWAAYLRWGTLALPAGQYVLAVVVKGNVVMGQLRLFASLLNWRVVNPSLGAVRDDWRTYIYAFTVPSGISDLSAQIPFTGSQDAIYICATWIVGCASPVK